MTTAETITALASLIDDAETLRSCYFWHAPTSASQRRASERRYTHDEIAWTEGGHDYTAALYVRVSCRNWYARPEYTRDGRKTTLTAIRNSLTRMRNA